MTVEEILSNLSKPDKKRLHKLLGKELMLSPNLIDINSEFTSDNQISCPHCHSNDIYGHGKYKGRKRYKCKECKKTFNDFTGTAVSGIKLLNKFEEYIAMTLESPTIRKVSEELKVNIKTAFDWRHKLLSALSNVNGAKFSGIVECDDKQLDINEKGNRNLRRKAYKRPSDRKTKRGVSNDKVSIIVATDRNNNPTMKFAKTGRIDADSIEQTIGGLIDVENILCSDAHPSIKSWASGKSLEHHTFIASKQHVKNKCYHVQHVNSLDNLYERWVKKFYGISTKYLSQYLNWFVFIRKMKKSNEPIIDLIKVLIKNPMALNVFRDIENNYLKIGIPQSY